jgi:hypothetical protein
MRDLGLRQIHHSNEGFGAKANSSFMKVILSFVEVSSIEGKTE